MVIFASIFYLTIIKKFDSESTLYCISNRFSFKLKNLHYKK